MKIYAVTVSALLLTLASASGNAALFDRGNGMIYDDVLDVTWLMDANAGLGSGFDPFGDGRMSFDDAGTWVSSLTFAGFDDWRLPSMDIDLDGAVVDCAVSAELGCRDNELGYMFYYNLGGSFGDNLSGDQGFFTNILLIYWSSTESPPFNAWAFGFNNGGQDEISASAGIAGAWAVRDGDVAVIPLPAAAWLMLGGLASLLGFRRR